MSINTAKAYLVLRLRGTTSTHHIQHAHGFALLGHHSVGIIVHVTTAAVEVFAAAGFGGACEAAKTNCACEAT